MEDRVIDFVARWGNAIVSALVGIVSAVVAVVLRRNAELEKRLDASEQRLTRLEIERPADCASRMARIVTLEQQQRLGVSHEDMKHAHLRIDALAIVLNELKVSMARTETLVSVIHERIVERHP